MRGGNQRRSLGEVVECPAVEVFKSALVQRLSDQTSLPCGGARAGQPSEFPFSLTSCFLSPRPALRYRGWMLCANSSLREHSLNRVRLFWVAGCF